MEINKMVNLTRKLCSTSKNVCKVCIVGGGPAGFYAAMHLTKKLNDVQVDIIEKLPVPFGLVRYGVAPDHPEVKNVINSFTKVAQRPNVQFFGNISIGKDIKLKYLRENYHAVLLAYGADEDKTLGIEDENHPNVISAKRFVGWYNGLPDDVGLQVDLSSDTAAVLGQGNVAMDVARILLQNIDNLKKTDITQHALDLLAESKIKTVYLVGRRGPLQAAFTTKELREQIKMDGCKTEWRENDFDGIEDVLTTLPRPRKRLTELMISSLKEQNSKIGEKYFKPIFKRSPNKFFVEDSKLKGIELIVNVLEGEDFVKQRCKPTMEKEILDCGVAFRSIGYKSTKADENINFDFDRGLVLSDRGRVIVNKDGVESVDTGLYVTGWLRTGPTGVILDTMSNAFQVAANIIEDVNKDPNILKKPVEGFDGVAKILERNNVKFVDWQGWEKIDKYEVECGQKLGKPREKVCDLNKMLEIAS